MASLANIAATNDRRASLIVLRDILAASIDGCEIETMLVPLSQQFRLVMQELDTIKVPETSKIDDLRAMRAARSA